MPTVQPLTLEQLLHMVHTQSAWVLPEFVGQPNPEGWTAVRWLWRATQGLAAVMVLAAFAQWVQHHPRWGLTVGVAAVMAAFVWWRYRTPRERKLGDPLSKLHAHARSWRGCTVEVAPRVVRTFGLRHAQQWHLEPAHAWSLDLLQYGSARRPGEVGPVLTCVIELRHVRQGPVTALCTLELGHDNVPVRQQVEQLVDAMALRLGIRRSGQGLLA